VLCDQSQYLQTELYFVAVNCSARPVPLLGESHHSAPEIGASLNKLLARRAGQAHFPCSRECFPATLWI